MDADRKSERIRELELALAAANAATAAAVAEKEAAVADKEAAEVKAANAQAAEKKKDKAIFMAALLGMSASASESSPISADIARRGAPEPVEVPVEVFFQDWPEVPAETVDACWQDCCRLLAAFKPLPMPLDEALESLPERAFVHAVLFPMLRAMTSGGELRIWHEATLADSVPLAEAKPDVLWTHARDVSPSSLGALLCSELKRWGLHHLPLVRLCADAPRASALRLC